MGQWLSNSGSKSSSGCNEPGRRGMYQNMVVSSRFYWLLSDRKRDDIPCHPTKACRRGCTASAALPLPAAPDARRAASEDVERDTVHTWAPLRGTLKEALMDVAARKTQLKSIAEEYFKGIAKKDMSAVPYNDHVRQRSPLAPG